VTEEIRVRDVIVDAQRRLTDAGVPSPSADAAEIVAHALGVPRTALYLHDPIDGAARVRIEQLMAKRITRVPLQHIIGTAPFRRMNIRVGPGVFTPRPETELVAEAAIRVLRDTPTDQRTAVDLCSGSGAIALALATELDHVTAYGVEVSPEAMRWAEVNHAAAESLLREQQSSLTLVLGDAGADDVLVALHGTVAVVTCNPPYIPDAMVPKEPEVQMHEPGIALFGGPDGLDQIRRMQQTAARLLRTGGLFVVEHADVQGDDQTNGVPACLADARADDGGPLWSDIQDRSDLAGRPRFTMAIRAA
jgi:release factor glutamine methyltransferase